MGLILRLWWIYLGGWFWRGICLGWWVLCSVLSWFGIWGGGLIIGWWRGWSMCCSIIWGWGVWWWWLFIRGLMGRRWVCWGVRRWGGWVGLGIIWWWRWGGLWRSRLIRWGVRGGVSLCWWRCCSWWSRFRWRFRGVVGWVVYMVWYGMVCVDMIVFVFEIILNFCWKFGCGLVCFIEYEVIFICIWLFSFLCFFGFLLMFCCFLMFVFCDCLFNFLMVFMFYV